MNQNFRNSAYIIINKNHKIPRCAPQNVELITTLIGGSADLTFGAHLNLELSQTSCTFWQNSQILDTKTLGARTRIRDLFIYTCASKSKEHDQNLSNESPSSIILHSQNVKEWARPTLRPSAHWG